MSRNSTKPTSHKVIMLGDSAVGKTCLVDSMIHQRFCGGPSTCTIGSAFHKVTVRNPETAQYSKMDLWDTSGQERFHALGPVYYRNANLVLLCYDISSLDSFNGAIRLIKELHAVGSTADLFLMVLKSDLGNCHQRLVSTEDGVQLKQRHNATFFELSAKENQGISELKEAIAITLRAGGTAVGSTAAGRSDNSEG